MTKGLHKNNYVNLFHLSIDIPYLFDLHFGLHNLFM